MNTLKETTPLEPQPEIKIEAKPPKETRQRKPLPCVNDWEFWRFLLAALSLVWEIAKTWVR